MGGGAVVLPLAVAVLYGFRNLMFGPLLVSLISGLAHRETGMTMDAGAVSGSWLRDLTFHDVRVRGGERSPWLASASADTLDVRYSLLRFVRRDPMPVDSITVLGLRAEIDAAAPSMPRTEPAPPFRPPRVLPDIEIRDASLEIAGPGRHGARLETVNLLSRRAGERRDLGLAVDRILLFRDADALLSLGASAAGAYDGDVLRVSALRLDDEIVPADVRVAWDGDGSLEIDWHVHSPTVSSEGRMSRRRVEATLETRALQAGPLLAFLLPDEDPVPDAACDISARFSGLPSDVSSWDLSLSGEARNACVRTIDASRIEIDARFREGVLGVSSLVLEQPRNRIEIRDARLPLTGTDPESAARVLTGRWTFAGSDLAGLLSPGPGPREAAPPHRAAFAGTFGDGDLRIDAGRVDIPQGSASIAEPARLRPRWSSPNRIEDVELEGLRLTALLADVGAVPALAALGIEGRAGCSIAFAGSWGRPSATIHLFSDDLRAGELPSAAFAADAAWDPGSLRVGRAVFTSPDWLLESSGTTDLRERKFDELRFDAAVFDAASLSLPGLVGGFAAMRADVSGPIGRPEARIVFEGRMLQTGRLMFDRAEASLRTEGLRADVESAEITGAFGAMLAAGEVEHDPAEGVTRARVGRFRLAAPDLEVFLAEPAEMTFAAESVSIPRMRFVGAEGGASVRMLRRQDFADIDIVLDDIDLRPLVLLAAPDADASGRVSGRLNIERRADDVAWQGQLAARDLRLDREWRAIDVALDTSGSGGRARLTTFEIRSGDHVWATLTGEGPFDPSGIDRIPAGDLAFRGTLRVPEIADLPPPLSGPFAGLEGAIEIEADLAGTTSGVLGDLVLSARRLAWRPPAADAGPPLGPGSARLHLRMTSAGVGISGHGALGDFLEARLDGALPRPFDLRAAAARGLGGLLDIPLDLACELSSAELDGLVPDSGPLRRLTGAFRMQATAEGTLGAPDLRGDLRWERGSMRLAAIPASFRQLELHATLDGAEIHIQRADGEAAGAPFSISGRIAIRPDEPVADLDLTGRDILLARGDGFQVRADAALALTGGLSALRLSGDLTIRDSWYRKDFRPTDLLERRRRTAPRRPAMFSFPNPPWSDLEFDVRIGARDAFRIETNLARLRLRPQLTLSGTGRDPSLEGLVYVDPGFLVLPSGRLNIDSGTAAVDAADPLVPRLDVRGSARMYGYDVSIHATGPYDDPEILFSASPPLTQEDILVMLATGRPPATGDAGASSGTAGTQLLLFFGGTQLPRWLGASEGSPGRELIDRLEVELGREVSRAGDRSVEMSLRLHPPDPFQAPYAYYLTAEQDIYRRINMGLRWARRYR